MAHRQTTRHHDYQIVRIPELDEHHGPQRRVRRAGRAPAFALVPLILMAACQGIRLSTASTMNGIELSVNMAVLLACVAGSAWCLRSALRARQIDRG